MKAIHGGKAKNDKIDSQKIAALLKGGLIPMSYVYPEKMRSTRDLIRRRNHLVRKRAELIAHIQNTNSQYNLEEPFGALTHEKHRAGIVEQFDDPVVQNSMSVDLAMIRSYDLMLGDQNWQSSLLHAQEQGGIQSREVHEITRRGVDKPDA